MKIFSLCKICWAEPSRTVWPARFYYALDHHGDRVQQHAVLSLSLSHTLTSCCRYDAVLSSCYTPMRCSPFTSATAVEECKQRKQLRFCKSTGLRGPQRIQGLQSSGGAYQPEKGGILLAVREASDHPEAICNTGPAQLCPYIQTKEHSLRTMLWYGTITNIFELRSEWSWNSEYRHRPYGRCHLRFCVRPVFARSAVQCARARVHECVHYF